MRTKGEKGYTKKPSKKEVKKKKVLGARAGQHCPVCKTAGAISKRDMGNRISLGDGMAPMSHLDEMAFLPLECSSCNRRFKEARESFFSRLKRTFINL